MSKDAYIHAHRPAEAGAPLLFAFHGTGGNESQLLDIAAELAPGAAIVAPRGDVSEHGAGRFFRRMGEGVYDMDDLARAVAKTRGFVAAWTDELKPSAVLGIGYSNGANILASAWIDAPELFDRAVLLHPLIPWTPAQAPGLAGRRVLITSGDRDPICPPAQTDALVAYFREQGADLTHQRHAGGHEIRPEELTASAALLNAA